MRFFRLFVACIIALSAAINLANGAEFFRKQTGTTTIAAGSTTRTIAITSVDMSKSFLVFSSSIADQSPANFQVGGEITNSTTLTFERTGNTGTVSISWQVLEFEGGVSVQHGSTLNVARGAAVNVAINCVDLTKSFVLISARKSGTQYGADDGITANLTTATNMELMISNAGPGGANMEEAYWQIIEYEAATVKKLTTTLAAGSTTATSTISPAVGDLSKTFVVSSHWHNGDINADDLPRTELTNATTVTYTRVGTTTNMNFVTYVVEFTDATTVDRGLASFSPAGTSTVNVTPVVTTASSAIIGPGNFGRQGSTNHSSNDNAGHAWFTYELTSPTNLRIQRSASAGSTANAPWQIVTFEDTGLQQNTFYSRLAGPTDWESNLAWSFTPDGSSGAVPAGVYPRRTNNVVIQSGHTIAIDDVNDNGPCSQSPDNLGRANVGAFSGSGDQMFYHTGDILIANGGTLTSSEEVMIEAYTLVENGGTFSVTEDIVNLGYLEISAGAIFNNINDLILSGNSITIMDNTSSFFDDLFMDHTDATLCGAGSLVIGNNPSPAAPTVQYFNSATSAQICSGFSITCNNDNLDCVGFTAPSGGFSVGITGPGGVGNSSNNVLWLSSDSEVYSDAGTTLAVNNDNVQQWNDRSGNAKNAAELTNKPTFLTNVVNGFPSIRFNNNDRLLSTGLTTGNSASVYVVAQYSSLPSANPGLIQGAPPGLAFSTTGSNKVIGMWVSSTGNPWGRATQSNNTSRNISQVTNMPSSTFRCILNHYDASASLVNQYIDNVISGFVTYNGTLKSWTEFGIGRQGSETWNGDISEVIAYNVSINAAQRVIVGNYLSAKYLTSLIVADDAYKMDNVANGDYDFEVAGIGQAADGSNHRDAKGSGIVRMWDPNSLGNSEFLMWGHDNTPITTTTTVSPADVDGTVIEERLARIWRLSESGGDVGAVSISFDFNSVGGSPLGSNLRLLIDRDGDGFGDNDVTPIVGSVSGGIAVFSNVNFQDGDRFTLGNTDFSIPLPIELINFDAIPHGSVVLVNWSTASELNNDFFTVEKSADAEVWAPVVQVTGAGTSNKVNKYQVQDVRPISGRSFYRLKQTDYDGKFAYSKVVTVNYGGFVEWIVSPNPSTDFFTISGIRLEAHQIRLYNTLGQQQQVPSYIIGGDTQLNASALPRGIYILQVSDGTSVRSMRLLKK